MAVRCPRCHGLLARPPRLSQGVLRVLEALGPDLSPWEWAAVLEVPVAEVVRALAWLGQPTGCVGHREAA